MRLSNRAAERFQRALDGERPADAEAESLLATSRMLSAVDTSRLAPREEFVHALRERLMAEAETMPTLSPAAAQTAAARRAAARTTPVVLVMGRGLPRLLAGAAASVLAVGAVVGVASRSALPGSGALPREGLARRGGRADGRVRLRAWTHPSGAGPGTHLRHPGPQ